MGLCVYFCTEPAMLWQGLKERSVWRVWEDVDLILGLPTSQPTLGILGKSLSFLIFKGEHICVCSTHFTGS